MTDPLVLRIQSKAGRFVLKDISQDSTLYNLQKLLEKKTSIPSDQQKILIGYPPKELSAYNPGSSLRSLNLISGESVIVEMLPSKSVADLKALQTELDTSSTDEKSSFHSQVSGTCTSTSTPSKGEKPTKQCLLSRRVVPANNSCLFESIRILLCSGDTSVKELRELAAGMILSNPLKFTTSFLGKTTEEYVEWILKDDSWGGAIELSIFCEHFRTELDVVDIQTQRIDQFGQDQQYSTRALLLYDGIHYDPLIVESSMTTVFPTTNDDVLVNALELAKEAYQAKQYTDVSKFSLRCLVCGAGLNGQSDALAHAKIFGHTNFAENSN